jgi:tRNA-specific 2-thiouridylase
MGDFTKHPPDLRGAAVLCAMSGGVDSSYAALRLKEDGARVVGASMKLLTGELEDGEGNRSCCSLSDIRDARGVCDYLELDFKVFNFSLLFEEEVIRRFARSYLKGLTPNPCIDCNRYLKFFHLMDRAAALGCDFLATGHYARIERSHDGRYLLKKALDPDKDQSYVLYSLTQEELARTIFPLGRLTKPEVRRLASLGGLKTAAKKESQDICFVQEGGYAAFLEGYLGLPPRPGDILDPSGKVLGRHQGILRYTIGQRRGLGIPGPAPLYVLGIDADKNTVTVGPRDLLASKSMLVGDLNLISIPSLEKPLNVAVKIRYRQTEVPATLEPHQDGLALVSFQEPQASVTPGQAAVFYQGDTVVGGGTIMPWGGEGGA